MRALRSLAADIFGIIARSRMWLYDQGWFSVYRSRLPVISVGNITAGGNGKTPLCLLIAEEAKKRGYRPVILSRGYGGSNRGPYRVSSDDAPSTVGDEPLLMAKAGFAVFISRKRVAGVKMIEASGEFDLVILDDGFQHRALARDLDIVAVFVGTQEAQNEFRAGRLLPLGMFREQRDIALKRADVVVLTDRRVIIGHAPQRSAGGSIEALLPDSVEVFHSYLRASAVYKAGENGVIEPQQVLAFAAIANPEGFFSSLELLGFKVVRRFEFPDHHSFTTEDIAKMRDGSPGLNLVCTSKDLVKLRALEGLDLNDLAYLPVEAEVSPRDRFFSLIEQRIQIRARSV